MAIVRRNNEILRVKDDLAKHYLDIGYDVIDEKGTVLQKAVPTDNTTLKAEYVRLSEEVKVLKAKLAEAEAKLNAPAETKPARRKKSDD